MSFLKEAKVLIILAAGVGGIALVASFATGNFDAGGAALPQGSSPQRQKLPGKYTLAEMIAMAATLGWEGCRKLDNYPTVTAAVKESINGKVLHEPVGVVYPDRYTNGFIYIHDQSRLALETMGQPEGGLVCERSGKKNQVYPHNHRNSDPVANRVERQIYQRTSRMFEAHGKWLPHAP